MDDDNPITRAGKELLMAVQKSVLELPGSIGWKKARTELNTVLEANAELAEFIDEDNGVSVLQAAAEDKRTQDIAENVVRAIGYGRKQVVNYQGKSDGGLQTALHLACVGGSRNLVGLLIQYGAEMNMQDKYGATPLHTAMKWVQYECAVELIRHGANVDIPDEKGQTPRTMWETKLVRVKDDKWRMRFEEAADFAAQSHLADRSWSNI